MAFFTQLKTCSLTVIATSLMMSGCQSGSDSAEIAQKSLQLIPDTLFSESHSVMPIEPRSRRKWDNPLIADLDKDGLLDVIITDHAHAANIMWNNGDKFSAPQLLIGGDTHGIAAADYDGDGRIDIIVSQGGGGGNNPRLPVRFQVNSDRSLQSLGVFSDFERSRGRAVKFVDSDNNGELDLVTSAFPLKSQKQGGNFHYMQNKQHEYEFVNYLPFAKWLGYKVLAADLNNDNDTDLVFYGGANMIAVMGQPGSKYKNASKKIFAELSNIHDVSSISPLDFDNDGDLDLLLTRAKHQFEGQTYFDEENGRFAFFARGNEMDYEDLLIDGDLIVENLQMAYPDFDVYVGESKTKLEFDVEDIHGHKDFQLTQQEAKGYPTDTSKRGLYIGYIGDGMWRIGGKTNSPTAAVIHNVKSTPKTTKTKKFPVKLLENRNGRYVDVTKAFGIDVAEQTSSAVTADFDNDGWTDILIIRYGDSSKPIQQIFYKNVAGKQFVLDNKHGVISQELGATGHGIEAFDYDNDGDMDIFYANERGRWHLFTNNTSAQSIHNFIKVRVGNSPKQNSSAQNAVLRLKACGNNFIRFVGASSAAFSHSFDTNLHIGLGSCASIDTADVTWSNGETAKLSINQVNQLITTGKF